MAEREAPAAGSTEERELIRRTAGGDRAAFERLYRLHVGLVYGLCLRFTADPVRAETFTQDAFVRAWEKIGTFRGTGPFGGWIRRLTINLVIESMRSERRESKVIDRRFDLSDIEGGTGRGGSVRPVPVEEAIDLERAIATLPAGARTVFLLHDVEGFRHQEIAEKIGRSTGTVRSQVHRARRLLREALGGMDRS